MSTRRVLSVGQCAMDNGSITRVLREKFGATVVPVPTAEDALNAAREGGYALVLVNRVFDADGASGLELIRRLKSEPQTSGMPVMLVSNYEDAQQQAVNAGAERGFGKGALTDAATEELLKAHLLG